MTWVYTLIYYCIYLLFIVFYCIYLLFIVYTYLLLYIIVYTYYLLYTMTWVEGQVRGPPSRAAAAAVSTPVRIESLIFSSHHKQQ
jgi:hypothetical protein